MFFMKTLTIYVNGLVDLQTNLKLWNKTLQIGSIFNGWKSLPMHMMFRHFKELRTYTRIVSIENSQSIFRYIKTRLTMPSIFYQNVLQNYLTIPFQEY
jgi:hypothetical protein